MKNASPNFVKQPICCFLIHVNYNIHGKLLKVDTPSYPTYSVHIEFVTENMAPKTDITTSKMLVVSRQEICWEEEYINKKCFYEFKLHITTSFNKEIP
jgi:hypothetical protein